MRAATTARIKERFSDLGSANVNSRSAVSAETTGHGGSTQASSCVFENGQLTAPTSNGHAPFSPRKRGLVPLLEPFIQPRLLEEGIGEFLKRFVGYEDRPDLVDQVWATVRGRSATPAFLCPPVAIDRAFGRTIFADASNHVLMLSDHARTLRLPRRATATHAPRKVVAEIGCGSGVLSCFAARAGARHVFAIEETTMIEVAREIAERNGLAERISVHRRELARCRSP